MKVALLADIHGNAPALECVLDAARSEGVGRLLIAGDMVGYYYDIVRVMDLLTDWDWVAVQGNHEDMLARVRDGRDATTVRARYGSAIDRAVMELSPVQLDFLTDLPSTRKLDIDGIRVLICHGSPWDRDTYVYPDSKKSVRDQFFETNADLILFGHSHYPVHWRSGNAQAVNPGSVGQPRDRKPGACWALWNTGTGTVSMRREAYDPAPLIAACAANDPHLTYLSEVLTRR
ncbi:MAG: YfcE family phosphodiesterase [Rhodospirillales bacterium]